MGRDHGQGAATRLAFGLDRDRARAAAQPRTATRVHRQHAHARYLEHIARLLLADLDAAVDARGYPPDLDAWQTQREPLADPRPQACLTCVPTTAAPITEVTEFGDGRADLAQSIDVDRRLRWVSKQHQRNRTFKLTRLIVRGHADLSEPDPEALGHQRAEAVAQALIGLGVKNRHIEVRSYGAKLRITNDPSEAALNRRVDFEVVTRRDTRAGRTM